MLHVVVNGMRVKLPKGGSVLQALRRTSVRVPALCHDDRMVPSAAERVSFK